MTTLADQFGGHAASGQDDRSGPADTNQTSLACLTTYAPGVVLLAGQVYGQLGVLGQEVHALEERLDHLGAIVEQQSRRHDEHVATLAACQRDTARVVNRELEQQVLYPAIEAVAALAEELSRLKDCASQLPDASADRDGAGRLRAEIDISCSVAREKLAHLDVQQITPAAGDQLDPKVHTVCGGSETAEENLHGRISQLVTGGLAYRGKVLRQARVLVFCRKTPATNHNQRRCHGQRKDHRDRPGNVVQ